MLKLVFVLFIVMILKMMLSFLVRDFLIDIFLSLHTPLIFTVFN